jgi:uncharacterized protein YjhX (UPF0386 family)
MKTETAVPLMRLRLFVLAHRPGFPDFHIMDISRSEQRILHLLAQGGRIEIEKDDRERIEAIQCLTRNGWQYPGFDLDLFRKLKRKKAIASSAGGPYRITRRGLQLVRSELDNR